MLTNKEDLIDKALVSKKQKKLEPWTWLRLESRNVVIEIANKIEEEAIRKREEEETKITRDVSDLMIIDSMVGWMSSLQADQTIRMGEDRPSCIKNITNRTSGSKDNSNLTFNFYARN